MNSTINQIEMMLIPVPKLLINFVIMEATFLGFTTKDTMSHLGAAGAIILAFILRLGIEWGKNALTAKGAAIQAIFTLSLCFLAIYVWYDFLNYKKGFEIYLFLTSLFSVFIVGELEIIFKIGFRPWVRGLLLKITPPDDKEITK